MASNRSILFVWFFYFLFSSFINNKGIEASRPLSKDEDIELEKQLKLLNKPAIKTIQTEYGNIYDCVNFYKQPAFDHPLLKNHSFHFQMRPSSRPKVMREKERSTNNTNIFQVGVKGLGCPFGTVPIRRVTKDDLIRVKLQSERYNSNNDSKFSVLTIENPGTHYAVFRTIFDTSRKYNGGGADICIFNPNVASHLSSSSVMKIQNGPDSIQVGWTVNQPLYGSSSVRFFIHTKTGRSQCFNTQCPGFVLVNDFQLDAPLPASIRSSISYYIKVFIYRDRLNGNWWLEIMEDGSRRQIGFWPQKIFTGLADLASDVEWGGVVSGPPDIPSAPMGSSYFPTGYFLSDGNCLDIRLVNEAHEVVVGPKTEEYGDVNVYKVQRYRGGDREALFGGPGGVTGN